MFNIIRKPDSFYSFWAGRVDKVKLEKNEENPTSVHESQRQLVDPFSQL